MSDGFRTLHLFAGAGGGLLADRILGHTPIGAVELDPYCCAVLRERAADGWFPGLRVHEIDIRLFDPSEYAGRVDCVSGGFPCTDVSVIGSGAGLDGAQSGLWSEFVRVVRAVRPQYAFIENSPALVVRGLDRVLSDLAALGLDAEWTIVSAADVGAPHRRERIWILADSGRERAIRPCMFCGYEFDHDQLGKYGCANCQGEGLDSDVDGERLEDGQQAWTAQRSADRPGNGRDPSWWEAEPGVCRVVDGLAHRVDRIKALGNGQVPQQAALAWRILINQFADE